MRDKVSGEKKNVLYKGFRPVRVISGGNRFFHSIIDGLVYYVIYTVFEWLFSFAIADKGIAAQVLLQLGSSSFFFLLFPLYYIVFEHLLQRTPGKFFTKCVVIDVYGKKPDLGNNIIRNAIRLVPFEAFSCLFNDRGWHDQWSDTYVVHEKELEAINRSMYEEGSPQLAEASRPVNAPWVKWTFMLAVVPGSLVFWIYTLTGVFSQFNKFSEQIKGTEEQQKIRAQRKKEEATVDEMLRIYKNGNVFDAKIRALSFLKEVKTNHRAWIVLGYTYLDQDSLDKASDAFKKAQTANKRSYEPYVCFAMVHTKKQEHDKALTQLKTAFSMDHNSAWTLSEMADVYYALDSLKKAIECGELSMKLDSTDNVTAANLASYYHLDGQFKKRNRALYLAAKYNYKDLAELVDEFYPDTLEKGYFSVKGKVTHTYDDKPIENAKIEVFNGDDFLIHQYYTDKKGGFDFDLPGNDPDIYKIKVSDPLYYHKIFTLNTKGVSAKKLKTLAIGIHSNIGLSEKVNGVDYSFLDKPIVDYFYDTVKNVVGYDKALIEASVKRLAQLRADEEKLKK